jgi:hypothetical protein
VDETPEPVEANAEPRAPRPLTFASLGQATGICVAWYVVAVTAYFIYANGRSATVPAGGCTGLDCPSERDALLTLGFFGLLPTAFVSLLVSLVVLVFAARSLRAPVVLGTVSALAGMVLGAIGFVTIATYDVNSG